MKNSRKLVSKSMLTADMFYTDPVSGNRSILGIFSTRFSDRFPMEDLICVCAALTNGWGEAEITASVIGVDEATGEEFGLYATMEPVKFGSPLDVLDVNFILADLIVPAAGEYRIRLSFDDQEIEERRIVYALSE